MEVESPFTVWHGSKEYWWKKSENYKAKQNELIKTPISPDDIPSLLTVQKKKRPTPSKPVRVTQVCGSMESQNVLEKFYLFKTRKKKRKRKREKEELRKDNH